MLDQENCEVARRCGNHILTISTQDQPLVLAELQSVAVVRTLTPTAPPKDRSLGGKVIFPLPGHWAKKKKKKHLVLEHHQGRGP